MNNPDKEDILVLDKEFLDAIGDQFDAEPVDQKRSQRLLARVMDEVDADTAQTSLFDTIRSGEGDWIEILPNVHKKILNIDEEVDKESYLLRMAPGATAPSHEHDSDELCYVIEGDLAFGDVHLNAGDYHIAYRGSRHGEAITRNGTLLFIQSGIGYQPTA